MTAEINQDQATFFAMLETLYLSLNQQDPLARLRAKGWDHFVELGLPTRKAEVFKYVKLADLYSKSLNFKPLPNVKEADIAAYILPECTSSCIVFINGQLDLSLSRLTDLPKKVVAITLQEALRSFGSFINNQVIRTLQEETDPFAALNAAFVQKSLFFYVPPGIQLQAPLQILNLITGDAEMASPRTEFFFGALSEGQVVATTAYLNGKGQLTNAAAHFFLEEGSQVSYTRLVLDAPSDSWHFDSTRAQLKKDCSFKTFVVQNGSAGYRDDYRVNMLGSGAEAYINGIALLKDSRECHTHVLLDHQAPECRSLQLFKFALDDASHSSFEGKIYIHKIAQKTAAYQLNNNLLLSKAARAESKPNLEIFADDVKATHGATFGQLDADQLFYMAARGIALPTAKNLLIHGFCGEVIEQLNIASVHDRAKEAFA